MRSPGKRAGIALIAGCALIALYPAVAQRGPQSILPPGFGEPDPPSAPAPRPAARPPEAQPARPDTDRDATDVPELTLRPPVRSPAPAGTEEVGADEGGLGEGSDNASVAVAPPQDLPPQARRSLDQVGLLPVEDGGFGAGAFGTADGRYLATLMDRMKAPVASRWVSILLRRALLSQSSTPQLSYV